MLRYNFLILLLILLNGCSTVAYYSQAISGQMEIYRLSQPIESLVADPNVKKPLKQKLTAILKIRAFASKVLDLPDNSSYTYYADLKRPYVVWSIFATPTFSFQPKKWCFPIVGCVSYRGHFAQAPTQTLAKKLRTQGYDVYVAGIPAYSTLGWFSDPVLNTMLGWPQADIAGLIFHELAHQKIYIKNDTAFNEAFARTVEYVGTERWLARYGTTKAIADYKLSQQRQTEFVALVLSARNDLIQIYKQTISEKEKLASKKAAFKKLRKQYLQLKQSWGGYTGYDAWFAKDLNNAKLLSVATYQDYVPAFRALLRELNNDLPAFYKEVTKIGKLPLKERNAELSQRQSNSQIQRRSGIL
jgi:predicted aminopeptidase